MSSPVLFVRQIAEITSRDLQLFHFKDLCSPYLYIKFFIFCKRLILLTLYFQRTCGSPVKRIGNATAMADGLAPSFLRQKL